MKLRFPLFQSLIEVRDSLLKGPLGLVAFG
jgi:hypothetical protein